MAGRIVVTIRVPPVLRTLTAGRSTLELELAEGATVDGLLDVVAGEVPALARRVRDERGDLRAHVNVFLGDENIRALQELATPLGDGDEVSILAAISGG